jgi:diguanylate cyclase (GGDEF)-like protein
MKDPRLVEIEFLSALERERSKFIKPSDWAKRLGVTEEFFVALAFNLFADHCLIASASVDPPNPDGRGYAGFDPSNLATWTQYSTVESVRRLLKGQAFPAYINHAGRLRLFRVRDEMLHARRKDEFDLLWNKRHWTPDLSMHLAMADGAARSVVLFIDVDDFKAVNEKASHLVGDEVLRMIFQIVLDKISDGGDAYRWGGDEIAALLPGTELAAGQRIGESIRAAVENQCAAHEALRIANLTTTVSVGVGAFAGLPTPDQVTAETAALMKRVKKKGKNSVLAENLVFGIASDGSGT